MEKEVDLHETSWLAFNPLDEPSEREIVCEVSWRRVWRCLLRRTARPPAQPSSAVPVAPGGSVSPSTAAAEAALSAAKMDLAEDSADMGQQEPEDAGDTSSATESSNKRTKLA